MGKRGLIFLLFLSIMVSCARSGTHPYKRMGEDSDELYTVKGEVLWNGATPVVYPIPTTAYRGACGKRHAKSLFDLKKARLWHKRLLDIAVWLEPVWEEMTPEEIQYLKARQKAVSRDVITILEKDCEFQPNMIVVPIGSTIEIFNEDRKDHWFVLEGMKRKKEQYVQYYGERPSVFTFSTPGVHHIPQGQPVVLFADKIDRWHMVSAFHLWMDAWIVITNKIWFDETLDKRGIFEITGVPRGIYRVHTWHPLLGENSSVVRVPEEIRGLVAVNYEESPHKIDEIPSTIITTTGEVREEKNVWQEIEDW